MQQSIFDTDAIPDFIPWQQSICTKLNVPYLLPFQQLFIFHMLQALDILANTDGGFENLMCLFPTGMGKSVCFMGPITLLKGFAIVVYPLNALIADQERRFKKANIPVVVLQGGQDKKMRQEKLHELRNKETGVIVTNPETLISQSLEQEWSTLKIKILIIDEVHLVVSWGESFRPVFGKIGLFRKQNNIPVLAAFSATVPDEYLEKLYSGLFLNEKPKIIRAPMDRPNLYFSAIPSCSGDFFAPWLYTQLAKCFSIEPLGQPSLVFSRTRNATEKLSRSFQNFFFLHRKQLNCTNSMIESISYYHAGIPKEHRKEKEEWFFPKEEGILHATCAYGTGIDKSNIRSVLHLEPPENPESYIQESGRGGRDNQSAIGLLVYNPKEIQNSWAHDYIQPEQCKKAWLTRALSDELDGCSGCDSCDKIVHTLRLEERLVLWIIHTTKGRLTEGELIHYIQGRSPWSNRSWIQSFCNELSTNVIIRWLTDGFDRGILKQSRFHRGIVPKG